MAANRGSVDRSVDHTNASSYTTNLCALQPVVVPGLVVYSTAAAPLSF